MIARPNRSPAPSRSAAKPRRGVATDRPRARARGRQLGLEFRTWGGARSGAGRKPKGRHAGVTHAARPALDTRHPVLVTLKLGSALPSLRAAKPMAALRQAFSQGRERLGLRLVHYAVQPSHIHLVVEVAPDGEEARCASQPKTKATAKPRNDARRALSRGLQGLCIRIARGVNRAIGRSGRLFADRYHARALTSPRAVRHALAYVLLQRRRHAMQQRVNVSSSLDTCSSGGAFDGWRRSGWQRAGPWDGTVVGARCWLLAKGWRRHGLIDPEEVPALSPAMRRALEGPWVRG